LARRTAEIVGRVDTAAAELSAITGLHRQGPVARFQSALRPVWNATVSARPEAEG
jgi:hypothetical protein